MSDSTGRPDGLQAWTELSATVDAIRVAINRDLQAEVGLTLADNLVLCRVAMAPGKRLRMIEIASGLNIAKSAVTKTVDRLEQRGLLTRGRDPGDRRTVYASLTSAGQKVFEAARPSFATSVDRHFTRHLDPAQIRALHQLGAGALAPGPPADRPDRLRRDGERGPR